MNTPTQTTSATNIDWAAFALRVGLGTMFLAHGLLKVFAFTPEGTAGYFRSIGLPGFLAWPTIIAEVGGGLLLIAGLFTRLVAVAMLPILLGALFIAHWNAVWVFSNQGGGWEYPAFLVIASVAAAFLGNGRFAVKGPSALAAYNV